MVVQADVEDGTGGIKCSCSLVKSIQVKAVQYAFHRHWIIHARPWIIEMERHAIKMKGHEYKKQEHECNMKEINATSK